MVAYEDERRKRCRVGKITELLPADDTCVVHRFGATTGPKLRVKWEPMYHGPEGIQVGAGLHALVETIAAGRVITVVDLHAGVLGHAAARRLDVSGRHLLANATGAVTFFRSGIGPNRLASIQKLVRQVSNFRLHCVCNLLVLCGM